MSSRRDKIIKRIKSIFGSIDAESDVTEDIVETSITEDDTIYTGPVEEPVIEKSKDELIIPDTIVDDSDTSMIKKTPRKEFPPGEKEVRIVIGCPCWRKFGDEQICMNNDDVRDILPMLLAQNMFDSVITLDDMDKFKSSEDTGCYLSIFVNKHDNIVYCIAKQEPIKINKQVFKSDELERAEQFLQVSYGGNNELCSECMYKYIRTLSPIMAGTLLSKEERIKTMHEYTENFARKVAKAHSEYDIWWKDTDSGIDMDADYNIFIRTFIDSLKAQEKTIIDMYPRAQGDSNIKELLDLRHKLCRLESRFYTQIYNFRSNNNLRLIEKGLIFLIETSNQILKTNEDIKSHLKKLKKIDYEDEELKKLFSYGKKGTMIERNFGNLTTVLVKK